MTTLNNSRNALIQESNNGIWITLRVKKVYTTNVRLYLINPDWTTQQLVDFIKPYVAIDFELAQFDLVEAGQETGPAIRITSNIKISEMFGNLEYLCFYVRERVVQ